MESELWAGLVEVLTQQAEEIAGLAQFGVQVGKIAFLAGDEFVVEHQPEHGLVDLFGQRLQGFALAVLHEVLHGLGLEQGGFGTGVGGGGWVHKSWFGTGLTCESNAC